MRSGHPTEQAVGMEYYVSDADGVGGRLREDDADFRVRELERFATEPVDAPTDAYPHLVFRATLRGGTPTISPRDSRTRWESPVNESTGPGRRTSTP